MTPSDLQAWLNAHGQRLTVDGSFGTASKAALFAVFTNTSAPAVNDADIIAIASRLGCQTKQLRAVAKVESGGAAFDSRGHPKILFERHIFHRLTNGQWDGASFSNPQGGGYNEDSWDKLASACAKDPWAAFQSASWGKFQEMGFHWQGLHYASPIDLAYSTVLNEANHYELFARFIEANGLKDELARISTNPIDCQPFAKAYNGAGYRQFDYDGKIARAMA